MSYGPPEGYEGHHFCWVEFGYADKDATTKFYADLFGWRFTPFEEMPEYVFFQAPSGLMGGFNGQGFGRMQQTIPYIYVPEIDAALAEIEAAGGKTIVPKMAVGGEAGHIALFTDPAGVTYGLADMYMPLEPSPNPFTGTEKPEPNTICFFEIFGGDFEATNAFFTKVFGWTTTPTPGHTEYLGFNPGAGLEGVFQGHTKEIPVMAYIWVDDVAATLEKVKAAGGTPSGEPMVSEMGVFGYFQDPSGVWIGLLGAA
jgi:hypothetical protein